MSSESNFQSGNGTSAGRGILRAGRFCRAVISALGLAVLAGCETSPHAALPSQPAEAVEAQTLREGDVLKIAFPGAPNLDTQQPIRRDGRISLSIVGEVVAAGMTPAALEKDLMQRYSTQLVSKEVTVTVMSSSYAIFVTGAVMHPGKIISDHPMSAFEAIMEAGGFDNAKANSAAVRVIRIEDGQSKNYTLNLKLVLEGKGAETKLFYLKPSDTVFVPEKFSWF